MMLDINSIATQLWQARQHGHTMADMPALSSRDEAYAIQSEVDAICQQTIAGYKVGATNVETQQLLNVDAPFYGPLYKNYTHANGAEIKVHENHLPRVEAEFVIKLKEHIQPEAIATVSREQIEKAIDNVSVAFEFIGSRLQQDTIASTDRGLYAIADFGSNLDFVVGCHRDDWQKIDLSKSPVSLTINNKQVATGHSGLSVVGHPFEIVAWLANQKGIRKNGLPAGTQISCGTCTSVFAVEPGDTLTGNFGDFGELTCTIASL